jgi:hypothetical protein
VPEPGYSVSDPLRSMSEPVDRRGLGETMKKMGDFFHFSPCLGFLTVFVFINSFCVYNTFCIQQFLCLFFIDYLRKNKYLYL